MLQNKNIDSSSESKNWNYNLEEKVGSDDKTDSSNVNDDGNYKFRHKRSFKISENVFSTFNAIIEKPEI